ncbi:MAG: hypothetical protein RLZ55_717, partial [Actinomycetota bacterium]
MATQPLRSERARFVLGRQVRAYSDAL